MLGTKVDALAGSLTGFSVRAITQPLDVLKIRLQLQVEDISPKNGGYYQSIPQAVNRIVREEGVVALWKGHVPGQFLSILFTASEHSSGIKKCKLARKICDHEATKEFKLSKKISAIVLN
ncbi:hypothetical protein ACTXT7_014034 [Hymenolepis weldensis]